MPNNHILTQNLYHDSYDPKPKVPSYWVLGPSGISHEPPNLDEEARADVNICSSRGVSASLSLRAKKVDRV